MGQALSKLFIILFILNVISFLMYACDKTRAICKGVRIPEWKLLFIGFFAPFGAFIGMKVYKHKTRKPIFKIGIPFFMGLNIYFLYSFIKAL